MATKKKVLSDQDYEEFNKMMAEYEASPTPAKIRFAHDDGSIWYEGMRGGHGDRDFVRHRLHYPAWPYSITLQCDALDRCGKVADDENSTLEDIIDAVNAEFEQVDDTAIEAALYFFMGSQFTLYEDCEEDALNCCEKALELFRELSKETPVVYLQYVVGTLDVMGVVELGLQKYDDAEKRFKEGLDICRRSMVEYSAIDWSYQTILAYQHLALVYEGKELPQKAKSFIEEGWRTFLSNEDAPIPTDYYKILVENVVRIYQACGEKDKAVAFWNENAESDQTYPS